MPAFTLVNDFTEQLSKGVHQLGTHVYKIALTNTAPVVGSVSWTIGAFPAPAAANGYTAGGHTVTLTVTETAGVTTVQGSQTTITATAGGIGPFRFAILYNDTATSPADAIVGFSDYGSSITLNVGEPIVIKFNNTDPGTIFTVQGV